MSKRNIFPVIVIALIFIFGSRGRAQILNPVIITWQADNFYPADYAGRALPSFGTPVTVTAEVLQNNKLLDVSQANFLWYVDENLVARGVGLKQMTFNAQAGSGGYDFVRVVVQAANNNSFENSTRVYVTRPTVVLEGDFPNQTASAGSQILIQAIPYFFNITSLNDLNFSWLINNNQKQSGNDNQLLLTINNSDAGAPLTINVSAQNSKNQLEFGNGNLNLNIQ